MQNGFKDRVSLIWKAADQLRGDYKPYDYAKVILPLVVLRRLDCVLAATKTAVLATAAELEGKVSNMEPSLLRASGQSFYNTSKLDFEKLLDDPAHIADHLRQYIASFSPGAAEVMTRFGFEAQIAKMDEADLLYRLIGMFANVDLHPDSVSNHEMGYIFEELIRGFSEQSNETAGEHFTPREVIRLMVSLLFAGDDPAAWQNGTIKTLYDPTCGTGGMLSVAEDFLRELNTGVQLEVFGQELNDESYAICRSDMMIKGQDPSHIHVGNTLTKDGEPHRRFDYMLSNPPFGVEWKKVETEVRKEATTQGFEGRFGAGLPRINDGSFLFLQHMISKMKASEDGGSRLAIVFNSSTLTTGEAGSGESEIRRWIIENDWLETIVALPNQLFYNTPLYTFVWIVTNRKEPRRRGKVQLIDARELYVKKRPSLGDKRKEITLDQATEIVARYQSFNEGDGSRIFNNSDFGSLRVTVERPLRLRYEVGPTAIARLETSEVWGTIEAAVRERVVAHLGRTALATTSRDEVRQALSPLGKLSPALDKLVWWAVSIADATAPVVTDAKGRPQPDPDRRDFEDVPLPTTPFEYDANMPTRLASPTYREAVGDFVAKEVEPFVPGVWIDHARTRVGYEIPLTRVFYRYAPARDLEVIDAELRALEGEIQDLLSEATA